MQIYYQNVAEDQPHIGPIILKFRKSLEMNYEIKF
jgi:hypothetical protein